MFIYTLTNLLLNLKSVNMMKLSLNAKKLLVPSYLFVRTSSFLLRLSSSVLDSTADLTFDPVSARFSTGTQPRSVIQQNQNNMALHSGYESKLYPVYALQINIQAQHLCVWVTCLFKKHTQSSACIIAINVDEKEAQRNRQDKYSVIQYAHILF